MHLKLVIQYDGTNFAGSQLQAPGRGRTVQGELEAALARITGHGPAGSVRVALAGRTDSGVHALGQVASLDFPARPRLDTPQAVQKALNGVLPPDLAVVQAEEAPPGFHARYSARSRAYRYLMWNCRHPAPLLARYSLHVPRQLDVQAMDSAAAMLVGTHDFAAFAGQGLGAGMHRGLNEDMDEAAGAGQSGQGTGPSTTRTVYLARVLVLDPSASPWAWGAPTPGFHAGQQAGQRGVDIATQRQRQTQAHGRLVAVDIIANAFLPQMVRTIVGTLLDVGYGKRTVQDMTEIIHSRDRRRAGQTAKPHGLCLLWVSYNSHDMGHHTNGVPDWI